MATDGSQSTTQWMQPLHTTSKRTKSQTPTSLFLRNDSIFSARAKILRRGKEEVKQRIIPKTIGLFRTHFLWRRLPYHLPFFFWFELIPCMHFQKFGWWGNLGAPLNFSRIISLYLFLPWIHINIMQLIWKMFFGLGWGWGLKFNSKAFLFGSSAFLSAWFIGSCLQNSPAFDAKLCFILVLSTAFCTINHSKVSL